MENQAAHQTIITEDVEISGTITAKNGVRVDGKLTGDINCASDVLLGKSGTVKGNINAGTVTVEGQINGNMVAKDRISLKAAARITGDVKAKRMTVEDGVTFVGKAEVNPSGAPASAQGQQGQPAAEDETDANKARGIFGRK